MTEPGELGKARGNGGDRRNAFSIFIAMIVRDPALGLLHMNPGACFHIGWHTKRTMLRFTLDTGKIGNVERIELGPRGHKVIS